MSPLSPFFGSIDPLGHVDRNESHLPNLNTFNGVLDLVALCNYMLLARAMVDWVYYDNPSIHGKTLGKNHALEVGRLAKNRKRARKLLSFLFATFEFSHGDTVLTIQQATERIHHRWIVQQANALMLYKERAWAKNIRGEDESLLSPQTFQDRIFQCFNGQPMESLFAESDHATAETFAWTGLRYSVSRRVNGE